jgi:hypothetical protein
MAIYRFYSQKDRKIKSGYYDDLTQPGSNKVHLQEELDYAE